MHALKIAGRTIRASILRYFPERQIHLHSGTDVRVISVGTRAQLLAAGLSMLIVGWLGLATMSMIVAAGSPSEETLAAKDAMLVHMQRQVTDLKGDVASTAHRLEQRQAFLVTLLSGRGSLDQLVAMMPRAEGALAAHGDGHVSVLAPFQRLEREQLAFVDQATMAAEARYKDTQALLRRLGLSPSRLVGQTAIAMGGPASDIDDEDGPLADADPKFKNLFLSWKKVEQLERAVMSVPSLKPVRNYAHTSGFGIRYDPFTGATAMHAGVDLAGPVGEPIYASADGVVQRAGWHGAYGRMIDLGHGKGIATRYAHLSAVLVRPGERVKKGELIGRMGSTGRSTGSHLHYEVRIDGRAVNPRPFLEASEKVLAVQERAGEGMGGPEQPAG